MYISTATKNNHVTIQINRGGVKVSKRRGDTLPTQHKRKNYSSSPYQKNEFSEGVVSEWLRDFSTLILICQGGQKNACEQSTNQDK